VRGGTKLAEELWQKYLQTRDKEARDVLLQEYLPLVKQVAGRLSVGLPPQVDEDDLIASGVIGLLEAMDRFNPSLETGFRTFATWRIRGAMLDELRKLSWSPRSLYKRLRDLQEAEQQLGHRLGHEPSIEELANELQWSVEAVEQVYAQFNSYSLVSLESLLFPPSGPGGEQGGDIFLDEGPFVGPEERVERQEWRNALVQAIEELPQREKLILALYYKEELTLREIGQILKVSTARVSQIHARILRLMRGKLHKIGFLE
jgi:RNA polymerase sigma factor for flagellar operon FliA